MKRKFYRGFFTNGSVKNVGIVDKALYGYESTNNITEKNKSKKIRLVKYNFCYCKRNVKSFTFKKNRKKTANM